MSTIISINLLLEACKY